MLATARRLAVRRTASAAASIGRATAPVNARVARSAASAFATVAAPRAAVCRLHTHAIGRFAATARPHVASAGRAVSTPSALPLLFRRFASTQPPQQPQSPKPTAAPSSSSSGGDSGSGSDNGKQPPQQKQQRAQEQSGSDGADAEAALRARNRNIAYYVVAVGVLGLGLSYAVVPLYRKFCQVTGMGGIPQETSLERLSDLRKQREKAGINGREVIVQFTGNVNGSLDWQFEPVQDSIRVRVGEPALAFYTARNNLDHPVVGVATYNVNPPRAGLYFNKVQCFCFDEQRVHAGEEVQLPVHFFLDTAMEDDPKMDHVNHITLSYTFFEVEHEFPDTNSPHFNPNQNHTAVAQQPHPDAAAIAAAAVAAAKHRIATGTDSPAAAPVAAAAAHAPAAASTAQQQQA